MERDRKEERKKEKEEAQKKELQGRKDRLLAETRSAAGQAKLKTG